MYTPDRSHQECRLAARAVGRRRKHSKPSALTDLPPFVGPTRGDGARHGARKPGLGVGGLLNPTRRTVRRSELLRNTPWGSTPSSTVPSSYSDNLRPSDPLIHAGTP